MSASRFLTVNVYPSGERDWSCAIFVRESGAPTSRLVKRVPPFPLGEHHDLFHACMAASRVLLDYAEVLTK